MKVNELVSEKGRCMQKKLDGAGQQPLVNGEMEKELFKWIMCLRLGNLYISRTMIERQVQNKIAMAQYRIGWLGRNTRWDGYGKAQNRMAGAQYRMGWPWHSTG